MTAPSLVRTELGSLRRPAAASASDSGCLSEAIPGSVQGAWRGCHSPTFQARVGADCIPARSLSAEETPGDRFPTLTTALHGRGIVATVQMWKKAQRAYVACILQFCLHAAGKVVF